MVAIRAVYFAMCLAAVLAPVTAQSADLDLWECRDIQCAARAATRIATEEGVFDHGANLSRDADVLRLADLEQQRWREFRYVVGDRARVYAATEVDRDYVPADWPGDIGLGNASAAVSLVASQDGDTYRKIDNGAILPAGRTCW